MDWQILHMRGRWPNFTRTGSGYHSVWCGQLKPSDDSMPYEVSIVYSVGDIPSVHVVKPTLHPKAPHRYGDGSLCLYWPVEWEWHDGRLIAETIVPWTSHWLYFYELWQVTGEWLGPSAPH